MTNRQDANETSQANSIVLLWKKFAVVFLLVILVIAFCICIWQIVEAAILFHSATVLSDEPADANKALVDIAVSFFAMDVVIALLAYWIYFTKRFFKRLKAKTYKNR